MSFEADNFVEHLAAQIITKSHPRLVGVKIAYLMNHNTSPAKMPRAGKHRKLGKTARVPEKYAFLTEQGYDFLIEIKQDLWTRMDLESQEALLDHELCHCGRDADGCYVREHDVTEFREIIDRHGFWQRDLRTFYEASQAVVQKQLFPEPDKQANGAAPAGPPYTININIDQPCSKCGKKGSLDSGICMKCATKLIKTNNPSSGKKHRSVN